MGKGSGETACGLLRMQYYLHRCQILEKLKTKSRKPSTANRGLRAFEDSSSDSDFEPAPSTRKRPRCSTSSSGLNERLTRLEEALGREGELSRENTELKVQLQVAAGKGKQLMKLQSRCTDFKQCFECIVCKDTVEFPAVVSPCCNIMLGCESHIQECLDSNPQCPHCREPLDMEDCTKIPLIRTEGCP